MRSIPVASMNTYGLFFLTLFSALCFYSVFLYGCDTLEDIQYTVNWRCAHHLSCIFDIANFKGEEEYPKNIPGHPGMVVYRNRTYVLTCKKKDIHCFACEMYCHPSPKQCELLVKETVLVIAEDGSKLAGKYLRDYIFIPVFDYFGLRQRV